MANNTPKIVIFSAPSGAGKTTIVRHLLKNFEQFGFSISACTRSQRPYEIDGKDYYFISLQEFQQKIKENAFVEWEEVYNGSFYGTLKMEVKRLLDLGKVVLFDVDVKGGIALKNYFDKDALSIFVAPPSLEILENRLRQRKTDSEESIQKRLEKCKYEMTFSTQFDVILENNILNDTLESVERMLIFNYE
jgi:guanylate kinase